MEMEQAMLERKSTRGYLNQPVSKETLEKVLRLATRAVSAQNMQPWQFVVVTGEKLDALRESNIEDLRSGAPFDIPEPDFPGVYRERRVGVAKQLLGAMDIKREDKERRNWWLTRGFRFFDAPVLILLTADNTMDALTAQFDIGCVTQNLCYAAMQYGLGTCVQTQAVMYQRGIREILKLGEDRRPVVGVTVGYPDPDFPANHVVTTRAELSEVTAWIGF